MYVLGRANVFNVEIHQPPYSAVFSAAASMQAAARSRHFHFHHHLAYLFRHRL